MVHRRKSDNGINDIIVVHIHFFTVYDPPFRNFQLTLQALSKFSASINSEYARFLVIRRVLVCSVSHEQFTLLVFQEVKLYQHPQFPYFEK